MTEPAAAIQATDGQRRRGRPLLWLIITPIVGYTVWLALAWSLQVSIMFPRSYAGPSTTDAPAGAETIWIDVPGGGRVEAWLLMAPGASAEAPAPLAMFFHGNAELIEHNASLAEIYHAAGVSLLMVEYRGYGRSDGTPSEAGIVADALAALRIAEQRPGVDAARVVLHGRSLGGGVAAQVAAERAPAGIILESTFTSAASLASRFLVPGALVRSPFRTDRALASYAGPALILHGTDDTIIPHEHGVRLAGLSDRFTLESTRAGHNDLSVDRAWYASRILGFLDGALGAGISSDRGTGGS